MFEEDYRSFLKFLQYDFRKKIFIPNSVLKKLYDKKVIFLLNLHPKQEFVYKFVDLLENNLCVLEKSEWTDLHFSEKPVIHHNYREDRNYGDLSAIDGKHKLSVKGYKVTILVDDNAEFTFSFDEQKEEHMEAFFNLFYNFLYENLYLKIINKRIEEIKENETNMLLETFDKMISNL